MKIQHSLKLATLSGLCIAALTGCGSLQKSGVSGSEGRVVTLADGRQVVVSGQKEASQSSASTDARKDKKLTPPKGDGKNSPAKPKKPKKKKEQQQTADREAVGTTVICDNDAHLHPAAGTAAESDKLKTAAVEDFSLNGEWTIQSVRGNAVTGEERPYVAFDLAAKRFYGNNGCNYINGDLTVTPNSSLKLSNMISTMRMCHDDQYQYLINLALDDVTSYSARQEGHEILLDLNDSTGKTILVLRRHNMDFLNGAWKVTELNGTPLVQEDDATMTFDTTDLKIHGTTGCNIFNGELFIDPDKTTSLQVLKLATTRMACPPDSRETEFLLALESVETAKAYGHNEVTLYDTEGKPLFKLVKVDLREETPAE